MGGWDGRETPELHVTRPLKGGVLQPLSKCP